ncbi:conserved hypothetical protein [Candidatus Methylobacter favarea]|uniref:Uncharacterized protein n=1 Tax=Candidatus Methylobacter favarea TaxID=2707345 RepID=A0A8S0XSA9_9GAMM|nr:hypothetical protein [Candidatus Methylobacter favarea]CAA9890622.1 conserved hypothetical protein [Candidatus Methylobacter favarea]
MTTLKERVLNIIKIFHSVKDENLKWRQDNQDSQAKLKHSHVLAEKALEAELKKRSAQLEHDITLLRAKHDAELSMFKTRCKQDVKDYKQYLESLDQLKRSIQASSQSC